MAANQPDRGASGADISPGGVVAQAGMGEAWQSGAGVRAGSRVLDVAAGTGEQTLVAARRVGPTGQVLATDIAAGMLDVAAEEVRKAGLTNVETRVMDAQR